MIYSKNIVDNVFLFISLILCLSVVNPAQAWTAQGHSALTDAAFRQLTSSQRQYYEHLTEVLDHSSFEGKGPAQRWLSLSQMPDRLRDLPLKEVFARFDVVLPSTLVDLAERDTSNWHYHNNVKEDERKRCGFKNHGMLLEAMQRLDKTLKSTLSPGQEALVMGFQLHLMQDLHQPLHTFSRLDAACQSDRGGNLTCVRRSPGAKDCDVNLHLWWDRGFGRFDALDTLASPSNHNGAFAPAQWARSLLPLRAGIYQFRRDNYRKIAGDIVDTQLALARDRQHRYLQTHWQNKHRDN